MSWEGILALTASAVTLIGLVLTFMGSRRANRTNEKKASVEEQQAQFGANLELNRYIDDRVDRLVEDRITDVREELMQAKANDRTRTNAFIRILRAIANQWPQDFPGPYLDPADIAAVEETIPSHWIKRKGGDPERT